MLNGIASCISPDLDLPGFFSASDGWSFSVLGHFGLWASIPTNGCKSGKPFLWFCVRTVKPFLTLLNCTDVVPRLLTEHDPVDIGTLGTGISVAGRSGS